MGAMRSGLAEEWWSWVRVQVEESEERLQAAHNLADSYLRVGKFAEAERILLELFGVTRRLLGPEHHDTLNAVGDLASALLGQGKHAEAQRIDCELLGVRKRVLGAEHPSTLATLSRVAYSLRYLCTRSQASCRPR